MSTNKKRPTFLPILMPTVANSSNSSSTVGIYSGNTNSNDHCDADDNYSQSNFHRSTSQFNSLNMQSLPCTPMTPNFTLNRRRNHLELAEFSQLPKSLVTSPVTPKKPINFSELTNSKLKTRRKYTRSSTAANDELNKKLNNLLSPSSGRIKINQLTLEKVLGFTIQNNASVALDPTSGVVAFPAGCVVVGYSAKRSKQFFIHNTVRSSITAIAFSRDGKLLATGESGKLPKVRIWNVESRSQVAEYCGHNFKIGALTFSPNSRFVVSVGSQEDNSINVWELSSNMKLASSKVTSRVNAIAFSDTGQFFVTVGSRHVRFWYLDSTRSKTKTTVPLMGRSAILGDFMNNIFNDVACCCLNSAGSGASHMSTSVCSSLTSTSSISSSQNYTYVVSQAGQLMQFTEQRYLDKWVELRTPKATCLTVYESIIMVGCSRGIVLIFDTLSLSHISTLPMPHYLGIDLKLFSNDDYGDQNPNQVRYPDIIGGKYDHLHSRITCFYNDHSIYVWDIRDIRNPIKVASNLYHSGGVWSVEPCYPHKSARLPDYSANSVKLLDVATFVTCSDDDTIRFWYLPEASTQSQQMSNSTTNNNNNNNNNNNGNNNSNNNSSNNPYPNKSDKLPLCWKNNFSKDLIKIIYTDPNLKSLIESDRYTARNRQSGDANSQTKHGIRNIKISPYGNHLASGDREGNLRIYSLDDCRELYSIIAHNGEILSIEYFQSPSAPDLILFCSASRDRVIHVMDPTQQYRCIQTIDDHSGAIFSARLVETPSDQEIRLVSCGMDKSLLFRILQPDESGQTAQFFLSHHLVGRQSQYDMVISPNRKHAAVVCQDRQVRIYNLATCKLRRTFHDNGVYGNSSVSTAMNSSNNNSSNLSNLSNLMGVTSMTIAPPSSMSSSISNIASATSPTYSDCTGNLLRCAIDPSGTYLATCGSDKHIHLLNFITGELVAVAPTCHSEVSLGVCFLDDLKHLVTVSADSCVFVWRLPVEMSLTMHRKLRDTKAGADAGANCQDDNNNNNNNSTTSTTNTALTNNYPGIPLPIKRQSNFMPIYDRVPETPSKFPPEEDLSLVTQLSNISGASTIESTTTVVTEPTPPVLPESTFRFSVSALPSWAQKKFSRRDSITYMQVNMLTDYSTAMPTVMEHTQGSNIGATNTDTNNSIKAIRRMSFIATEKIVRDDDSDNVDEPDEDDSDTQSPVDKNGKFPSTIDLEASYHDDEDDEDDDANNNNNNNNLASNHISGNSGLSGDERATVCKYRPLRSGSLDDEGIHKSSCGYTIQTIGRNRLGTAESVEKSDQNDIDDLMSTSAPSTFSPWLDEDLDDQSPPGHTDRISLNDKKIFDNFTNESLDMRSSLTTSYLSKSTFEPTIVNFQTPIDNATDISKTRPPSSPPSKTPHIPKNLDTPTHSIPTPALSTHANQSNDATKTTKPVPKVTPSTTRKMSTKSISEVNVNAASLNGTPLNGRPSSGRSNSKPIPRDNMKRANTTNITNYKAPSSPKQNQDTSIISRSMMSINMNNSGNNSSLSAKQSSTAKKPMSTGGLTISRKRWGDPKQNAVSRVHRQTCPVQMKDVQKASQRKHANTVTTPATITTTTTATAASTSKILADRQTESTNTKRSKEHVIDDFEEIVDERPSTTSGNRSSQGAVRAVDSQTMSTSVIIDDMFQFLNTRNEDNRSAKKTINSSRRGGGELMCDREEVPKTDDEEEGEEEESNSSRFTNQWVAELCGDNNPEILIELAVKVLQYTQSVFSSTNSGAANSISVSRRAGIMSALLVEVDRVVAHIRHQIDSLNRSSDTTNTTSAIASNDIVESHITASIIRDIGERIVDEVKRRLSESL